MLDSTVVFNDPKLGASRCISKYHRSTRRIQSYAHYTDEINSNIAENELGETLCSFFSILLGNSCSVSFRLDQCYLITLLMLFSAKERTKVACCRHQHFTAVNECLRSQILRPAPSLFATEPQCPTSPNLAAKPNAFSLSRHPEILFRASR